MTIVGLLITPSPATNVQAAATLLGAIAGLGERSGDTLSPFHQRLIGERSTIAQQRLTPNEWQAAWQVGQAWTPTQAAAAAEGWLGLAPEG